MSLRAYPVVRARVGRAPADGFSFVELIATLAIVAALASMAMPLAQVTAQRHKEAELHRALRDIRIAIDRYKQAATDGLILMAPGRSGYPQTLAELAEGVDNPAVPGARLYFLRRIPRDPFHPDAALAPADTWGLRSFASPADNPRPGDDVFDVYSQSDDIALDGTRYRDW